MRQFAKPKVVVSKCLEFEACRYNGDVIKDPTVHKLNDFASFIPVCPEVAIGLGVPRETIRIVKHNETNRLVQPSTGQDLSDDMLQFSDRFLAEVGTVDGFILKNRSPSCGVKDVKVYAGTEKSPVVDKTSGFFGGKVVETHPYAAVEEEGRLKNFTIREKFLTRIFTMAAFREMKGTYSLERLSSFHDENRHLFMAYSRPKWKKLNKIVANLEKKSEPGVYEDYEAVLNGMFSRAARYDSNINACLHMLDHFKEHLNARERTYFFTLIDQYKEKKQPLSSLLSVVKSWAYRFECEEVSKQTYFEPYPLELHEISDSGKGRDYG